MTPDEADDPTTPTRGPIQGLEDLSDFVAQHPVNAPAFVRGLTIGVLVGAAVAGLSMWRRMQQSRADRDGDDRTV